MLLTQNFIYRPRRKPLRSKVINVITAITQPMSGTVVCHNAIVIRKRAGLSAGA